MWSVTYGLAYVSNTAVADLETCDVLSHFDDFSYSFVTRDELGVISLIGSDVIDDKGD